MDGDEGRSGATAVCDGDTGDEAVTSGDVAPAPVPDPEHDSAGDASTAGGSVDAVGAGQAGSTEDGAVSAQPATAGAADPDDAVAEDPIPDDTEPDGAVPGEQASAGDGAPAGDDASEPTSAVAAADATPAPPDRRLRPHVRRGMLALVAAGFVAIAVGAFAWAAPSSEGADQRFVDAARSQGHVVAPGVQQALVVSAARKICDRRILHDTDRERQATALTTDEIAAVGTAFGADTRDFTTLALETYCSS